jgi:3-hydroxybutyryl-CoA dehydrogenase
MKNMVIAVLGPEEQQSEWLRHSQNTDNQFVFADSLRSLLIVEADIYIDMLFEFSPQRIEQLKKLNGVVIVNSVEHTTTFIGADFVRIAGWSGLIHRDKLEIAYPKNVSPQQKEVLQNCGLNFHEVPDIIGMITPRILSMIINEAYYALGENVSNREEIDTAMKTGTNYPLGPFEWAGKIGLKKIHNLLKELGESDEKRYGIAPKLEEEVLQMA